MSETSHVFISYSRENQAIVEQLRSDLQQARINIWIDKIGLKPSTPDWDDALRIAIRDASAVILVASPNSRRSAYVRDEIAIAKGANKPIYPVWVDGDDWMDTVPMGMGTVQNVDLRGDNYAKNLPRLIGSLSGQVADIEPAPIVEAPAPTPAPIEPRNPYKGLRAFRAEDQADFFGRDALVETLFEAVGKMEQSTRFLAVLGASGSGKSSVMMAGLLPKLQGKYTDWLFLDPIVPGNHPLEKLTITLARQLSQKTHSGIREDLLDVSTRGLHRLACELSDKPVILYIDQFEEVFTLVDEEYERRQFIDLLTTASTETDSVLYVLLSMRADFYDRPAQYREFGRIIEKHHVLITPMTLADLYDVVQQPALLPDVALNFDEDLVTEMVFAVREEAAALPLLQFTLDQLFERREGQTLTRNAYEELGGIQGALAKHAEASYQNLPSEEHQSLARALFLRLIEAGQTEQDTTRRRASYSELTLPDAHQTKILQEVVQKFVSARLLVSDVGGRYSEPDGETRTIEVSHEALIREWDRLGEWLRDAREDLRLQKSLAADVAEWKRREQPADMLYRGTVLAEALTWSEKNSASRNETHFLNESQRAETEKDEQEARNRRNLRYALGGLVAVIVIALAVVAWNTNRTNTELQGEIDFFNLEVGRFEILQAGNVVVPLRTQTPGIFEPTLTSIANLNNHDPSLPENQMIDESGIEMVLVPAGCFFMGSVSGDSDEKPMHEVCFEEDFWIDKYEVTNEQFGSIGCSDYSSEPEQPRNCVMWVKAVEHCAIRGARLPTEAEWKYAARGPNSLIYPWGNEFVADNGVYTDNSNNKTELVGSHPAGVSWVGAYDMSGNLWEWVSTIYDQEVYPYPYATDDGRENIDSSDYHVFSGGSFSSNTNYMRSANRVRGNSAIGSNFLGFRCARAYQR